MINALKKAGNRVTLITTDRTNWPMLREKYGLNCVFDREFFLVPNVLTSSSMTSRALMILSSYLLCAFGVKVREKHDLLINTSGEIINLMEDISYINAVPMRAAHNYPESLPIKNVWWRLGSRVYDFFLRITDGLNSDSTLLTNSRFNEAIIKRFLNRRIEVIYPPVDVEKFRKFSCKKGRKNLVVTISRFRPGKNLESIPKIAKNVDSKFLIIGPSDEASETTIRRINNLAGKMGVRDRIQLLTNVTQHVLLRALSRAKILLHTQFFEAFGMAVVEAMAAGCVPIVPNLGGPWMDILEEEDGKYGYSYDGLGEAVEKINLLIKDEKLRQAVSARASRRAGCFSTDSFEKSILTVVERIYSRKFE